MNVGDIVKIRNSVGILNVILKSELSLGSVGRRCNGNFIPSILEPRLEVHSGNGGVFVTLCDENENRDTMYMIFIPTFGKPSVWLGKFDTEESENIYQTVN